MLLIWSQSLCSGFKNEKICYKFGTSEYVLKEFSSFCVCGVFFFFLSQRATLSCFNCTDTPTTSHFVYAKCGTFLCLFAIKLFEKSPCVLYLCLKLEVLFGSKCGKMRREMRELASSFLAVSHKNFHGPIPRVLDIQHSPGFLPLHRWATLSRNGKGVLVV